VEELTPAGGNAVVVVVGPTTLEVVRRVVVVVVTGSSEAQAPRSMAVAAQNRKRATWVFMNIGLRVFDFETKRAAQMVVQISRNGKHNPTRAAQAAEG
jgi:hypothetical protein